MSADVPRSPTTPVDANHQNAASVAAVPSPRKRTLADYRLGRTLGEGSYSTVVAAVELSTRRDFAIKVLDKRHIIREKKVKYVNIEKNTLYKLDHPGIVKLYSTFQDNQSLYYVLELCQHGELLTFIKRLGSFDVTCTKFYAAQILTAIEYVHNQGVIHRDLKPENILLDQRMYIKLTDFGTAKMLETSEDGTESDRASSFVGTAEYVSPELLKEKSACKSSDLWALGCIIYQLLAGRPPFKGHNEYQTFQKIVHLEYSFPPGFPEAAKDLVERLLVHDPNQRLGANNRIDQLKEHRFFEGIEWDQLWEQPAPKLSPYLPPTPTNEELRSDHELVRNQTSEVGDSGSSHDSNSSFDDGIQSAAAASETASPYAQPVEDVETTSHDIPDLAEGPGDDSSVLDSVPELAPRPTAVPAISNVSSAPSTESNGHAKANGRNGIANLFAGLRRDPSKKLLAKKDEAQRDYSRENSSVSLTITANEITTYSKRAQLELQADMSPWHGKLFSTELIIYQSPVLKRKGLFSRSCVLVLTDFPRLLYFDDSKHYFEQLFNSNTNEAFSSKHRFIQLEQLELRQFPYQHQSVSMESHTARKNAGGAEVTSGSGFVLNRSASGSARQGHQQARSEYTPGPALAEQFEGLDVQQETSTRPSRSSLEHGPHHHHQHSHSTHHPQQSNGHNRIDVENSVAPTTEQADTTTTTTVNGVGTNDGKRTSSVSQMQPQGNNWKKLVKLRGEIFFRSNMVTEVKGKKVFFIHTKKKSYYFEELKEGDAERWVKVLSRCINEWFDDGADNKK
ncbi:kinase-like domain-containing protein [Mortierella sp. GBAus27b]|nr:kinase-like domain-containing protein [Mortierella sp. GBAus27b]